jgi:hypothetical protein
MELRLILCLLLFMTLRGIVLVLLNKYFIFDFIILIEQEDDKNWSFDCYVLRDRIAIHFCFLG